MSHPPFTFTFFLHLHLNYLQHVVRILGNSYLKNVWITTFQFFVCIFYKMVAAGGRREAAQEMEPQVRKKKYTATNF